MRYEARYRDTRREVLNTAETRALIRDRAEQGKRAAQAAAMAYRDTGEYIESITVRERSRAGDRPGMILTATAPYAQFLEQRYHTIANTVDIMERG